MAARVAVFIDYQNVHLGALHTFCPRSTPPQQALVHPGRIAERIVAKRRLGGELSTVRVYRGRPNITHQPIPAAANAAQKSSWERDRRVQVVLRDLAYRGWPRLPPREKGIDVALAVDLIRTAMLDEFDVGIVFSSDSDLLPAVEVAFHLTAPHIEVACWRGTKPLWFPDGLQRKRYLPYCHRLDEADLRPSETPRSTCSAVAAQPDAAA